MKNEELAFLNLQLAEMLRSGIPLEGALRRLCETMAATPLREELTRLGADLASGVPLKEAVARRHLPPLYIQLVQLGVAGNDLPGILTLAADHYRRVGNLWQRLKALMVYPFIVYVAAVVLFGLIAWIEQQVGSATLMDLFGRSQRPLIADPLLIWLPLGWLLSLGLLFAVVVVAPAGRDWLRWRLPGFHEAHLARFASTMQLLLHAGGTLPNSIELAGQLETHPGMGRELRRWSERLAAGHVKLGEIAVPSLIVPPLFTWLVAQSQEDVSDGFARAAAIYFERARYRTEMLLYAALPASVLVLGALIGCQLIPILAMLRQFMDLLAGD